MLTHDKKFIDYKTLLYFFIHLPLHTFNGPLSRTTQVSRYQKGKPIWIFTKQETVSGSGISCAICKSAPRSRQITTPAPHHSVFYRPDALPAAQPFKTLRPVVQPALQWIRYDTRCYFNMRSEADMCQLNQPHGTDASAHCGHSGQCG